MVNSIFAAYYQPLLPLQKCIQRQLTVVGSLPIESISHFHTAVHFDSWWHNFCPSFVGEGSDSKRWTGKHFFASWFPKDIQHCVVFPHRVWLLIKMRSLQSSQRRVHLSGSDSSGRVRPSYTDFTLLQHSAQPWDWNRLQLWQVI